MTQTNNMAAAKQHLETACPVDPATAIQRFKTSLRRGATAVLMSNFNLTPDEAAHVIDNLTAEPELETVGA